MKTFIKLFILTLILVNVAYSQMTEQWVSRYSGPGNGTDESHSIAVDGLGNVYVTGVSVGSGTNGDYATIKYNSSGVQQWEATYNGPPGNGADVPNSLAVDGLGNVYVTGRSFGSGTNNFDYATIKYNSSGVQQWEARYNGPGNSWDNASSLAVDGLGNVYVTGYSAGIGINAYDYATIKYSSSGVQQWEARYTGTGNGSDEAYSLAVDGLGNVYVAGRSAISGTNNFDYATIKYTSSGAQQWEARYNGPGNDDDEAYSLAVDGLGNVYVTGESIVSGTNYDYATIKYNSSGIQQWVQRYNGPGNDNDYAYSLAVDSLGNVYVTGESIESGTNYDYATIKYNSSGIQQWVQRYNGPGNDIDFASSLALDGSGNVYVAGWSWGSGTANDYATIKYNSSGVQQWVQRYNGPGNNDDRAYSLAVDGSGNVYVAGRSVGSGTGTDYATIKYAPVPLFVSEFKKNAVNKPINDNQNTFDTITVDYSAVTNYYVYDVNLKIDTVIHTNDSDLEFYLIHNGVTDTAIYQVGGTGQNFINTILNDSATATIASGTAPFTGSFKPYSPLTQFNGQSVNGAWILKIYDRATGNTGILKAWSLDFLISINPIGIQNISSEVPKAFLLSQNYPNPFNPNTNIKYQITNSGFVSIKVYDILGKEAETLVNENLKAGTYEVDFDGSKFASGIYFYVMKTENFIDTKKMILIK
jgi:uncharacterized delta-60 repeat protein